MGWVAASAAPLMHPRAEIIHNVDGGASRGGFPSGGTVSKIVARPAGGIGALAGSRPLSTGGPRKAAGMISVSYVRAVR